MPPMQYALTGNIGSGKTTVAQQFERLGIPVYYADAAAKRLMNSDAELRTALTERFGNETYLADGTLNRAHLAQAFTDSAALDDLNSLVHPAVHRDAAAWRENQNQAPYTLYEAAIVLEIGRQNSFDGLIVVDAPEAERQRRVIARDGVTPEQFQARAARQWTDQRKREAADYLILNRGPDLILPQVLHLHARLRPFPAPHRD